MLVCACSSSRCISPTIYIRADADTAAIYLLLHIAAKRLRGVLSYVFLRMICLLFRPLVLG